MRNGRVILTVKVNDHALKVAFLSLLFLLLTAVSAHANLRVGLLTQNASSLDVDEDNIRQFFDANSFTYDMIDAAMIKIGSADLSAYNVLYMRTGVEPVAYDDTDVINKIDAWLESGGKLIFEYYGAYLGQYLGVGTVTINYWFPAVNDAAYFAEPASSDVFFSNIATWSPPLLPDKNDQLIAQLNQTSTSYAVPDFAFFDNMHSIPYWLLLTTYGWYGQDTSSAYCQLFTGLCTTERSVYLSDNTGTFINQSYGIDFIDFGLGRVYKLGLNIGSSAPASNIAFGPVADQMRINLITGQVGPSNSLTISPLTFDFSSINVGGSSSLTKFLITNNTDQTVSVSPANIQGANPSDFHISYDSCSGVTLATGQQCQVSVAFTPLTYGLRQASLAVAGGGATVTAALSGIGGATGASTINGTVRDTSAQPISGATVSNGTSTTTTFASGSYTLTDIPSGDQTITVSKTGYATASKHISIPPYSSIVEDFQLFPPCSGSFGVRSVTSKFPDNSFYLDGTSFNADWTADVCWGSHTPGTIKFETSKGVVKQTADNTQTFDMGNDFGPCGWLKVTAISGDGATSAATTANFTVMSALPFFSSLPLSDLGNTYEYKTSYESPIKLLDLETDPVSPDIPIFGGQKFGFTYSPGLEISAGPDGTASYELNGLSLSPADLNIAGLDAKLSIAPDIAARFDGPSGGCQWDFNGSSLALSGDVSVESPPFYLVPGIYAKVGGEVSANAQIGVFDLAPLSYGGNFTITPSLKGVVGAGLAEALSVEGWAEAGPQLTFGFTPEPTMDASLIITAGFDATALGVTVYNDQLLKWEWPTPTGQAQPLMLKPSTNKLVPRDYLKLPNSGQFINSGAFTLHTMTQAEKTYTTATTAIELNIYPHSQSNLSSGGGNVSLEWLQDNTNRSAVNRTMVVFSTYDGSSWSTPQPIADDGTADFHPNSITFSDGSVITAWEDEKIVLPDTATLDDLTANLEISTSIYDPSTKTWQTAQRMTSNSKLDRSPKLSGSSKTDVMLVWISNASNDLWGSSTMPNQLWFSTFNGSSWSAAQVAADIPFGLVKYSLAYDGGKGYVVMSLDTDDNTQTVNDHELYMLSYSGGAWGSLTRLTNDSVADDNPQIAEDPNGNFVLTWLKGDEISSVQNFDMTSRTVIRTEDYTTNLADFKLASSPDAKIAIVWAEPSQYSSDLFAVTYDPIFQVWGNPKQLTFDPETEQYLTAAFYGSDTLMAVYDRNDFTTTPTSITTASGKTVTMDVPTPIDTDLYMMKYAMGSDLALQAGSLTSTPPDPAPGTATTLSVTAINPGDQAVSNVPVDFYLGDPATGGSLIGEAIISQVFKPGDTTDISLPWTIPQTSTPLTIYALIDPSATLDPLNRANNTVSAEIVKSDLTVQTVNWQWLTNTLVSVTARISNNGVIPSGATTVTFRQDSPAGTLLSTNNIDSLDKYQSIDVNYVWDVSTTPLQQYVLAVTVDEANAVDEFDETNNSRMVTIVPSAAAFGYTKIGVFDNGYWYLDSNMSWAWDGTPTDTLGIFGIGLTGAIPVVGDWNGDGNTKIGVFVNGTWYLDMNRNWQWDGESTDKMYSFGAGLPDAIPVVGDWDGKGSTKIGIYSDGVWYLDVNGNGQWDGEPTDKIASFGVGLTDAVPVVGDWNGDGPTKIGVYQNGYWYLDVNGNGQWDGAPTDQLGIFGIGLTTAVPVTGDWNADGITEIGIYQQGYWYLDKNRSWQWEGEPTDQFGVFGIGLTGAVPVPGKW